MLRRTVRRACTFVPPSEPMGVAKDPARLRMQLRAAPFPPERIRNFAIVAHVDHGKTTLSDAILRRTGVLADAAVGTYMDKLEVERERGITVKAQTATMFVRSTRTPPPKEQTPMGPTEEERRGMSKRQLEELDAADVCSDEYMINLIDTPGHVDFSYEVTRALRAADGAVLLVDATQGVEAQTMANFNLALECGLPIVPALSKLDCVIDEHRVADVTTALEDNTGLLKEEVVPTAARDKLGVEALLEAVIERVPPPAGKPSSPLRALLFDAWLCPNLERTRRGRKTTSEAGVLCLVRVVDGAVRPKDIVRMMHDGHRTEYEVLDTGIMYPEPLSTPHGLTAGQVGYVDLGMTSKAEANVGDTIIPIHTHGLEPVATFRPLRPVVFAGFFPSDDETFDSLKEDIERLRVNDPAVTVEPLSCQAFGRGLQLGFLGMLHLSVFQDRLLSEFEKTVLVTPAQVFYKYRDAKGTTHDLTTHTWLWKHEGATEYLEPFVTVDLTCPEDTFQSINGLAIGSFRGEPIDTELDGKIFKASYRMPLGELVRGFFDQVKSLSHGYATVEYSEPEYEPSDLVKIDVLINKTKVSALSSICVRAESTDIARRLVANVKAHIDRGNAELPIQAVISQKVIARETLGARKKDVLAKIHAGDPSRKAKKLAHQKEGKKRLAKRMVGQVNISQEALAAVMGANKVGTF